MKSDWFIVRVFLLMVIVIGVFLFLLYKGFIANEERNEKHQLLCTEICNSRNLSIKDCLKFIENECV